MVAAGSDHMIGHDKNRAVNPYNPFLSMWIMIARKTDRGEVLYPEERITRAEALKTHTIWSAYMQFAEKQKPSVQAASQRMNAAAAKALAAVNELLRRLQKK